MGVTKEIVLEILLRHFLFSINNNRVRKKYLKKQAQHIYIKKKPQSSQNSCWICFKFKDKVGQKDCWIFLHLANCCLENP